MAKETVLTYDLSEAPKYIEWEKISGKENFYEPFIIKRQNEKDPDAYIAMYARHYSRSNIARYRMDEYLFKVCGPTLAETLQLFGERLQQLQADGLIQGRYVCSEKLESKHRELLNEDVYYKLWYQRVKLGKY